ncbi:MAG TPA: hypothetical protein VEK82_06375, partial [Stellaceae bacterium]|nr:hypothetical protein [Stellaceae bacterium]
MHHIDSNNLASLAADLAEHLSLITGETWSAAPHQHRADVRTLHAARDGAELMVEPARERRRLLIVGSFWIEDDLDNHKPTRDRHHTITAAAERPVIAIARDIARRLLPAYRADLA